MARLKATLRGFRRGIPARVCLRVLFLISLLSFHVTAQSSWTTPVPVNPSATVPQDFELIAIGPQRQIAIACREGSITGRMAVYRSTNNGTTFLRTQIGTPPVPEFEMRRTESLSFDVDGNLYLLWSWNETPGGVGLRQWLVISKSTDGGQSFTNIWSNAQRTLLLTQHTMTITSDRTIHFLRDTAMPPPELGRVIYTRFINGNPASTVEVQLPRPGDTVYTRDYASIAVFGNDVHYAANGYSNAPALDRIYYSRSTNGGTIFTPMLQMDTTIAVFPTLGKLSNEKTILLYAIGEANPYPHDVLMFRSIGDSTLYFSSPMRLGTKWLSSDPRAKIGLFSQSSQNYLVYSGVDTQNVACYYQYGDPESSPTDSMFFPLLTHPDFALDSTGGKYIVAEHQRNFLLFFSTKDVIASVQQEPPIAQRAELFQNYPNPFNPWTTIRYALKARSYVSLELFDVLGRAVVTLVSQTQPPGIHDLTFDGSNLPSGVYFYRLSTVDFSQTRKLVLIR